MATPISSEYTTFTLDNTGRYLCNTLDEAVGSATQIVAGERRDFDVIVIGGGTFGSVLAQRLFAADTTNSRRILVLEAGPFVLPEHVQNMPFGGGAPNMRVPWEAHDALKFAGLLFAIGGRSLTWGGWSPELLHDAKHDEMEGWPQALINDLVIDDSQHGYFKTAGKQIGVDSTNDFIFGKLHTLMRQQLFDRLKTMTGSAAIPLGDLPESPLVRAFRSAHNGSEPSKQDLQEMLGLMQTHPATKDDLLNMLKLEAPLAVQSRTEAGQFPLNKFSAIPLLVAAARQAWSEAAGVGPGADTRKRLMVVGGCHVQELITETQSDNWVRVTGVRVIDQQGASREIWLTPPQAGRQSVVIIAAGTIESTRVALTTFQNSLGWRAAQRMGKNLMVHLRSNLNIRVSVKSLGLNPGIVEALSTSALFVKGSANVDGKDRYFHLQITASGLPKTGTNSEAELFKKIPDLDHIEALQQADDDYIVITLRGIGEMVPHNPASNVILTTQLPFDFGRPRAQVSIGDAHTPAGTQETIADNALWEAMDTFTDQVALIFAAKEPFEILAKGGPVIPVPANATPADLKNLYPHSRPRRDDLGTTHHETGTLWMGDDVATSVTNAFGRIHDTTNCYVAGPALFPTIGSPNPMLTGVALAERTAKLLTNDVLPKARIPAESGFETLFDGTAATFKKWRSVGQGAFDLVDGAIVVRTGGDLGLLYYPQRFADFVLRLEFRLSALTDNSGVFVRFRDPLLPVPRRDGSGSDLYNNPAYVPVDTGFEVQIDELARGNQLRGESDGMDKKRTGALYDIPTTPGWIMQQFTGRLRQAKLNDWNAFQIDVRKRPEGDLYTIHLNGEPTTTYINTDVYRGRSVDSDANSGFIGLQSHTGPIAFRHIRVQA